LHFHKTVTVSIINTLKPYKEITASARTHAHTHIYIQGEPKAGIQYIIVHSIITVYLLLAQPVCVCVRARARGGGGGQNAYVQEREEKGTDNEENNLTNAGNICCYNGVYMSYVPRGPRDMNNIVHASTWCVGRTPRCV
jgi:hypothetical protein